MSKFGVLKEVFEFLVIKRKFHMFPVIVNTSMNVKGEPIVNNPEHGDKILQ